MNSQDLLTRAYEWRNRNSSAWAYMLSLAKKETIAQRKFGVQFLIEEARKKSFATDDGSRFSINNSFAPAFARMLVKEHPEMKPYIELRKSELDGVI